MTATKSTEQTPLQRWLYPVLLTIITISWVSYMTLANRWGLFSDYWTMSLTMLFGSFIGSSTPQGGAAVAFPVFTKLLNVPAGEARTFGLMIQSVGMGMAMMLILARRIPILPRVIMWTTLGGILGAVLGTYVFILPGAYPRVLFTIGATMFGVALIISRWALSRIPANDCPSWGTNYRLFFFLVGIGGGIFTAYTGSGINLFTFIILTLTFGVNEKIGTPTSVIIMALNAMIGFFLHGVVSQDIGIVWDYWLVCVPIVAVGAPLGAFAASKVSRDVIIIGVLILIAAELISTLLIIEFTSSMVTMTVAAVIVCAVGFFAMLYYRQNHVPEGEMAG